MTDALIIEDNLLEQIRLKAMIAEQGFSQIEVVSSLYEAREVLKKGPPLLVLADVYLQNESILELLDELRALAVPTVFVSVSNNEELCRQLTVNSNFGYLVRPFDKLSLQSMIRLVSNTAQAAKGAQSFLLVRHQHGQKKLPLDEILWLETSGNYAILVTATERFCMKKSLRQLLKQLDERFVRVHKQFCVDVQKVSHLKAHSVLIDGHEIPVSYHCKKELLRKLLQFNRAYTEVGGLS
ncbi:response regulator [Rudanella paleaurantiibacter]|uniref:Response regulator n=1 Tax=Rudanella paleaurantiibacter TaxID=2614655 RepID=A0A7J5U5K0_9BACT|nr:LytTR family DNA-binding domain-containing protein [Rudanella paleaurantiibacter]KAB7733045.1 response regulator [Rudanella paleaurantiibacter]